jgi:amidohydrolase
MEHLVKSIEKLDINSIKSVISSLEPDFIQLRKNLHREPEPAWREFKTTHKIKEFLEKEKLFRITYPLETGLVADLIDNDNKPYLGLRADIDALPIDDGKTVEYRSIVPGMCHACGHDVHTTVVCGVAVVLKHLGLELPFNLRFIFQPAEEPIPSGAPKLIEKGVLENLTMIWGLHVDPELPMGTISLTEGWVNTQSIRLDWEIEGIAGHSSRPELTQNPISPAALLISRLQNLVDQFRIEKEDIKIFAFTMIDTNNTSYNTIPPKVQLVATLRLNSETLREQIIDVIEAETMKIGKESGLDINFSYLAGSPPVMNDPSIINKFNSNLSVDNFPKYDVLQNIRSRGSDDFGWYSKILPAALIRFGTSTGQNSPKLHTSQFDIPEDLIPQAILFFVLQILYWQDK